MRRGGGRWTQLGTSEPLLRGSTHGMLDPWMCLVPHHFFHDVPDSNDVPASNMSVWVYIIYDSRSPYTLY